MKLKHTFDKRHDLDITYARNIARNNGTGMVVLQHPIHCLDCGKHTNTPDSECQGSMLSRFKAA